MNRTLKTVPAYYLALALLVVLSSCAQQGQPSGGPKDTTPPEVLETIPPNQNTNFIGDKITFTFDEYMQIQDASNQFFISPPLKALPDFTIKKKSLIVTFKDTLKPNTTYNINFGESIKDINESNVLNNLSYAFSTGPYIDSLSLSGQVVDAFDKSTEKAVLVMLYDTEVDSMPMKKLPTYYTKCDENGNFTLTNLKEGNYKLIALKDKNSNLLFDLPEEEAIGFIDTLIAPIYVPRPEPKDTAAQDTLKPKKQPIAEKDSLKESPKPKLTVRTFTEEKSIQYLKKSFSPEYCKVVFVYNRPVEKIDIESLNLKIDHEWMFKEFSKNRDTVAVWLFIKAVNHTDSLILEVHTDTCKADTVELIIGGDNGKSKKGKTTKKEEKKSSTEGMALKLSAPGAGKTQHPNKGFEVRFNHPVLYSELPQIVLTEDSNRVEFTTSSDHPALRSFYINYDWKENKKYKLFIPPKCFRDFYTLENDTFQVEFKTGNIEDYGNLILHLEMPQTTTPHILQLLNDKTKVVSEKIVTKSEKITFPLLQPGSYTLKIIADENANGKWDTGNYLKQLQPEKIILHKGAGITIRANWDMEVEWQLDSP